MTRATDISSIVESWIGIGIAIIGITSIVGPLVLWLESRSDINIALNAVDDERHIKKLFRDHAPGSKSSSEHSHSKSINEDDEDISYETYIQRMGVQLSVLEISEIQVRAHRAGFGI